ncbi:uncharacterized protein [Epargyreus clarus]|uniref:uncharacterized protein n=1 Tax=Epargyreus clarus TaxID=520877 RepID=UPI003C2BE8DF
MLSRRDKLLVQPWEDRRFKDHRSKVAAARAAVDARAPARRPHVQAPRAPREAERVARVQRDNQRLLQRLAALMRTKRLDDRWLKPLPNFQQKVGQFYDERELRLRLAARRRDADDDPPYCNVKCYACDYKKMQHYKLCAPAAREDSLPSIY